jgi:hypothetical protein
MKWLARVGAVLAVVGGLWLTSASPALADGPTITHQNGLTPPDKPYDPSTPEANCTGVFVHDLHVDFTRMTWTDDGVVTRDDRHIRFSGYLVGPTGISVAYSGQFNGHYDAVAGVDVLTGLIRKTRLPNGELVMAAGRWETSDFTDEQIISGHHTFPDYDIRICDYLQG